MTGQRYLHSLRAILLLLSLATTATAQLAWLDVSSSATTADLGDTVSVEIHLDAQGRSLTSVGLSLAYDPQDLEVIDAGPSVASQPFAVTSGLAGGVYTNDVLYNEADDARARIVLVTGQRSGDRQVISGQQVLAKIRWRVIRPTNTTRIRLVQGGQDGPVFTELGHPGREQFIHLQGTGILLQILAEGFVPVEDLALDAQHPWHRPLSRIHPGDGLRWSIDHDAHHLLSTTADDGQLQIQARPRVSGEAEITYRAVDDDGEVLKGSFRVTVSAGAPLLALGPVTLQEDDMPHLLGDVVSARAPVGHRLLLAADAGLTIGSGADGWSVAGAPDWSGLSRLTLRLLDDKSVLIDSMQALVTVAPVDDPPELTTGIAALVAMVGTPSWGPYLADLIYDIDDDISRLSVGVHGDEMITAEVQDGRLRFEGQRAGEGVVLLDVADSDGGNWQFSLDVHVVAQAHGPRFLSWATPHLVIGQKQNWTWPSLLSDDGPLGEIQGIIEGSGNVSVWLTTDGIGVEALAAGSGWVRLLVSDSGGNTSSTILPVEVITDGPVDDPVDDLESDFVDPPVDPEPSSPTGEVEGPDAGVGSPDTVRTPENDNPSAQGLADLVMLNLPPRITLVAGTGIDMKLGDLLEGVAVSDVLWAVSGGEWVQAHVDETGTLRLTAPITAAGDDEVMIHVYVAQQRVSASLQIQLEAAPARLSISQIPAIRLTQGATHELDLSSYALDASGNVHWEIGPAQLVTTHIEEGVLLLKAKATQVGEEALRLTATDGTTQASRLLRVVVGPGESQTLRIQAPAPLTMSPGDRVELDLATWVLDGQVTRWEIQTPSATGILTVEGGQLTVQVADDSGPGTQSFQLVAVADLEQILVVLQVEIIPLPALSLTTVPDLHLVAGSRHALLAMGDLVSEADGPVGWQIVDAGQLPTQIGPLDSLIVDARQALPGRQVLRLRATTAARVEDMQIIVRIDAPVVVVSSWQAELTPGVVARLSLDAQAPDLLVPPEWHVRQVGSGITAAWDTSARRLTVVAEQPGQVHVEARLGSGLAVATSILTIRLLSEPNQTEPVAADSGATGSGQGEAQPAVWRLLAPSIVSPWAGESTSLALASLIEGSGSDADDLDPDIMQGLQWQARILGGSGTVTLSADSVIVTAFASATLWIQAQDGDGSAQSAITSISIRPVPPPTLEIQLEEEGLLLKVEAAPQAEASLSIDGVGVRLSPTGSAHLPLSEGTHRFQIEAISRVGSSQSIVRQSIAVSYSGGNGSRIVTEDGLASVDIAAGSRGGILICPEVEGYRLELSPRLQATGVRLSISHASSPAWAGPAGRTATIGGLQWLTAGNWVPIPSYQLDEPAGVTGVVTQSGLYRVVASEAVARSLPSVNAYPNPFNAQVTLQYTMPDGGGDLSLVIYGPLGQRVREWQMDRAGGPGALIWDGLDAQGRAVGSGVYLVDIWTPIRRDSQKILLVR